MLFNLENEKMVLACLLCDKGRSDTADSIFAEVKPRDFYLPVHQVIFSAMVIIYTKGVDIDIATLTEVLDRNGTMENIGGIPYLCEINDLCFSSAGYRVYLNTLKDLSKLRQLKEFGGYISTLTESGKTAIAVQGEAENILIGIAEENLNKNILHIAEVNKPETERLAAVMEGKYDEFGLDIDFLPTLNKCLWGLQKSDMITVAARPSVGKSAFALNILKHTAIDNKKKALFFSLEMPKEQQIKRLYSLMTGIDNYTIKSGKGLKDKKDILREAAVKINQSELYIDDTSNLTVPEMLAKSRQLQRKSGLDLVVIDYLQFVKPTVTSGNRVNEVGQIARDIKNLARQLNVPVIVLAQLNRKIDKENNLPVLADLRESGEIENNSDIVMFLHNRSDKDDPTKKIDLIIRKFRNGQTKNISLLYVGNIFKFVEAEDKKPKKTISMAELVPIDDDEKLEF